MKNLSLWMFSALAGMLLIFLLNHSPLYDLGFGLEIPAGWQVPPVETYSDCIIDEQLRDPAKNHCMPNCTKIARYSEGIPFATIRSSKAVSCGTDFNNLAILLNALSGVAIGMLYSFIAARRWSAPQVKTK